MLNVFGSAKEVVSANREAILEEIGKKLPDSETVSAIRFRIEWIVTELLDNHRVHGNKKHPFLKISVKCEITDDGTFRWESYDEGDGFDPKSLPNPTEDENVVLDHGRGVYTIREMIAEQERNDIQGVIEYPNSDKPLGSRVRVEMPI